MLLDIGGTIWPDAFPDDDLGRTHRIASILPPGFTERAGVLVAELEAATANALREGVEQDTLGVVSVTLDASGIAATSELAQRVRAAMVVPSSADRLFPGARELLAAMRDLHLGVVAVSNTVWRDAADYRRDFELSGVLPYFDAIVTSVDRRIRKPDPRIFRHALAIARTSAEDAVVIGNSEHMDIEPARRLGIRSVLVAIEDPPPPSTAADAVVRTLDELCRLVRSWAAAP